MTLSFNFNIASTIRKSIEALFPLDFMRWIAHADRSGAVFLVFNLPKNHTFAAVGVVQGRKRNLKMAPHSCISMSVVGSIVDPM